MATIGIVDELLGCGEHKHLLLGGSQGDRCDGFPLKWCGILAEGVLHIFPRTWAEGTAAKAYSTFTVDQGDYTPDIEPTPAVVNEYDAGKMKQGAPGRYLLETERKSGPIHVAVRGKCLAISAGHARSPFFYPFVAHHGAQHILVCHFGLEGEILTVPRYIYDQVIARSVPGNNPNAAKAERLRSFLIPRKYVDPGAREDNSLYKINILAAVVMEEDAFIVCDFARITQIHVISNSRFWTEEDMSPGSEVSPRSIRIKNTRVLTWPISGMEESYVQVYRKEEVRVPAALYDLYQSRGLLDPNHTIGTPYHGQWVPTDKKYKLLPVRFFEGGANNRYHVILAMPPSTWKVTYTTPCTFKDVTQAGYATTLGPASFREPMRNKLDPEAIANLCSGKGGRPKKVRTGERGRPRKPLTIATVKRIADIPRSAKRVKEDKENIDPVDQGEEELAPTRRYNTRSRMP
ncbi:hypothetical protein R3P38DRAFT_3293768 [Favolaschia claudopus]|uniref:Uncharacterized protein n=1 Tax=Favolaschia claudopus TaxID=2862362 RepID=A0AAV9ZGK8_9AGAR